MDNNTNIHPHNAIPGATASAPTVKRRRSPSVKRAETRTKKETDRGFPLPLTLQCIVTGKLVKYTSLAYIRKLIQKAGSLDAVRKGYTSAEGRKQKSNG